MTNEDTFDQPDKIIEGMKPYPDEADSAERERLEQERERAEAADHAPPYNEAESCAALLRFISWPLYSTEGSERAKHLVLLVDPNASEAAQITIASGIANSMAERLHYLSKLNRSQMQRLINQALAHHGAEERHLTLTGSYPDPNQGLIDAFSSRKK